MIGSIGTGNWLPPSRTPNRTPAPFPRRMGPIASMGPPRRGKRFSPAHGSHNSYGNLAPRNRVSPAQVYFSLKQIMGIRQGVRGAKVSRVLWDPRAAGNAFLQRTGPIGIMAPLRAAEAPCGSRRRPKRLRAKCVSSGTGQILRTPNSVRPAQRGQENK